MSPLAELAPTQTRDPALIDALMATLPPSARRWCAADNCRCSGCARSILSRDEWLAWYIRHCSDLAGAGLAGSLSPTGVRLIEGGTCAHGHPVEDLTCAYCGVVRYRGSMCEHVDQPGVMRRKWDNLPLCGDCLRASAP